MKNIISDISSLMEEIMDSLFGVSPDEEHELYTQLANRKSSLVDFPDTGEWGCRESLLSFTVRSIHLEMSTHISFTPSLEVQAVYQVIRRGDKALRYTTDSKFLPLVESRYANYASLQVGERQKQLPLTEGLKRLRIPPVTHTLLFSIQEIMLRRVETALGGMLRAAESMREGGWMSDPIPLGDKAGCFQLWRRITRWGEASAIALYYRGNALGVVASTVLLPYGEDLPDYIGLSAVRDEIGVNALPYMKETLLDIEMRLRDKICER